MATRSSKFPEAVKCLMRYLSQVMDAARAINECESFIQSASNANYESFDIQQNYDVLFDQGKRLLKECDQLIETCNQDHGQHNRSAINNNMQRLRQRIHHYQMQIDAFKFRVRAFASKLQENVKIARRNVRLGNNAQIGNGVSVSGSVLTFLLGAAVGGPLGGALAFGSIVFGGMRIKKGVEVHNVVKDVVRIKEDYEKTLNKTEESYRQLCEQHESVEKSFARCEELVDDY